MRKILRRSFYTSIILSLLIALVATVEVTGNERYPAGAAAIEWEQETLDPTYDENLWYSLSVGERSRTFISTWTSYAMTKTQWNWLQPTLVPFGEKMGIVAEEDINSGKIGLASAKNQVLRWLRTSPDLTLAHRTPLGGSAGLAFALAMLDASTPGSLSNHMVVSASGGLTRVAGFTAEVEGLEQKLVAAQWVKSDLVFVPYEDDTQEDSPLGQAYSIVGAYDVQEMSKTEREELLQEPGPLVVRIPSFATAVDILKLYGGSCGPCEKPEYL